MCMRGHAFIYLLTSARLAIIARPTSYAKVVFNVILVQMTMHTDVPREASFAKRLSAVVILIAPLAFECGGGTGPGWFECPNSYNPDYKV